MITTPPSTPVPTAGPPVQASPVRQILENDQVRVEISTAGAEARSMIYKPDQAELFWQADPAYWPRTSPVLFPIVGRLRDHQYRHRGQTYTLPQHGFARDREFELISQTANTLTYRLESDPDTLAVYPFPFRLEILYELEDCCLRTTYRVYNPARDRMYFSIGAHPGFISLPGGGEGQVKGILRTDVARYYPVHRLDGGLVSKESTEGLLPSALGVIELTDAHFEEDALIFLQPLGRWVDLLLPGQKRYLRLTATGWPHFGIWSKPGAPFICLEPWHGHADLETASGELADKAGIISLAGDSTWEGCWSVEVRS